VFCHYTYGGSLTVDSCKRLYKTTELRRINSRINKKIRPEKIEIKGEFLEHDGIVDDFMTYKIVKIKEQQELEL
jgi:hypothetical protein